MYIERALPFIRTIEVYNNAIRLTLLNIIFTNGDKVLFPTNLLYYNIVTYRECSIVLRSRVCRTNQIHNSTICTIQCTIRYCKMSILQLNSIILWQCQSMTSQVEVCIYTIAQHNRLYDV